MEEQTGGTKPIKCSDDRNRPKTGRDAAGEIPIGNSDALPDPEDEDCHISTSEGWGSSGEEETRLSGLAESLQILTESLLTMEQAEMEIFKSREAIRLEEEKRRLESEAEMTRMLLHCQLQIASFLTAARPSCSRKRKRVQEEEPSSSSASLER